MLCKMLVANRGEIAVRVARACGEMGIISMMVYSDADRDGLHVRCGNEAYYLGESPASESYLRGDRIIEIALASGCDAIHPGYGFLSENAQFATEVMAAGLIWIGPPPEAIALMGSKIASKRLAEAHGVPLVPGYFGDDQSNETLAVEAERIGYPVLVKASAGGGGKGMRIVEEPESLTESLEGARREAAAAFGDDALMIEKYLTSPRHIEVQVLGDSRGNLMHLGERDCTIQRRHQKVVEESPSPVIDDKVREPITSSAVALARAAGYSSAGTVEFIFQDGAFYFLEMNTRIQVEHPVTEESLGVDLIQAQIRIAGGESLDTAIGTPKIRRHAIEARLYAEDPTTGFLPSVGRLSKFSLPPQGENLRIDAGVAEGDSITPYYDPMLAKIITSGPDRPAALRTMRNALNAIEVEGPRTNLDFLRWLFAQPDFAEGRFSTRYIEENYRPNSEAKIPLAVLLAAGLTMIENRPLNDQFGDVWQAYGWRQGRQRMPLRIVVAGNPFLVRLSTHPEDDTCWSFEITRNTVLVGEGESILRKLGNGQDGSTSVAVELPDTPGSAICTIRREQNGNIEAILDGLRYPVRLADSLNIEHLQTQVHAGDEDTLASPMPGKVLKVLVSPSETVTEDQPLVIIEAMKMEFTVRAPHDGRIGAVKYEQGAQVAVGDILIEMEKPG